MELYTHIGNIFEIFAAANDIAFGTFLVALAVGGFLLGCIGIQKLVSCICNND